MNHFQRRAGTLSVFGCRSWEFDWHVIYGDLEMMIGHPVWTQAPVTVFLLLINSETHGLSRFMHTHSGMHINVRLARLPPFLHAPAF